MIASGLIGFVFFYALPTARSASRRPRTHRHGPRAFPLVPGAAAAVADEPVRGDAEPPLRLEPARRHRPLRRLRLRSRFASSPSRCRSPWGSRSSRRRTTSCSTRRRQPSSSLVGLAFALALERRRTRASTPGHPFGERATPDSGVPATLSLGELAPAVDGGSATTGVSVLRRASGRKRSRAAARSRGARPRPRRGRRPPVPRAVRGAALEDDRPDHHPLGLLAARHTVRATSSARGAPRGHPPADRTDARPQRAEPPCRQARPHRAQPVRRQSAASQSARAPGRSSSRSRRCRTFGRSTRSAACASCGPCYAGTRASSAGDLDPRTAARRTDHGASCAPSPTS